MLQELMDGHGGFDHNLQALRVIDLLEHPYRFFHGLNLANVVRWAHQLHSAAGSTATGKDTPANGAGVASCAASANLSADWRQQPLEGQVTNLADRIAYDVHDIEDALGAELVSERDLREIRLWRLAADPIRKQWPDLMLPAVRRHVLDALTLHLVEDLVATTNRNLASRADQGWEAFRKADAATVAFSDEAEAMLAEHETFLSERAYQHPRVAAMDYKARLIIRAVFEAHVKQPRLLPVRYFRRIDEQGLHRVVCDYIAGMTDRFCQDTYHGLFEPFQRL
jgi:dGTPase